MRRQNFSKQYARLASFCRRSRDRRSAHGGSTDKSASPLLTFVAAALCLILAIIDLIYIAMNCGRLVLLLIAKMESILPLWVREPLHSFVRSASLHIQSKQVVSLDDDSWRGLASLA